MEAHGQLMLSANERRPGTKYKRSKIAFAVTSIAFTVVHICTELLQLPAQSLIGSPGTLLGTRGRQCSGAFARVHVYTAVCTCHAHTTHTCMHTQHTHHTSRVCSCLFRSVCCHGTLQGRGLLKSQGLSETPIVWRNTSDTFTPRLLRDYYELSSFRL